MSALPLHTAEYRRRRFQNWFPLGLTYATFYMARYNLNVASTELMTRFNFSKEQFGIIATSGFWTYALAVFFNGPLADRIGGRRAILLAALGTAAVNAVVGVLFLNGWGTKVLVGMSLLYAVNQYFQSFGALSIVKVNAPWFHVRERGVFGGVFGIMISCGYFLAMTVGGWILAWLPWYCIFLIPSAAVLTMYVVDRFLVADKPSDAGFAQFHTGDATSDDPDRDKPVDYAYLVSRVFSNRVILTLIAAEFCTGFVRQGLLLWFVPFLKEVYHVTHGSLLFSIATSGITVGGIIGGLLCGWMSDRLFQSRRPPVAFIFYLGQIVSLLLLHWASSAAAACWLIGFNCVWIFGVHGMLSGTASMDFGGTRAAATVTGLLDGIQYVASGLTGFLLGAMLDKFGWGAWTLMIVPFSIIGAVLMLTLWNATPGNTRVSLASPPPAPPREAVAA
ncbi:MAG: MFS transporter [Elusimicrobia bacterium]|nr:MFS transporter [Elusimicrobiota bacterium]MDE2424963.1 MFS transporter [Elusimicrobiota bacterium]